MARFEGLVEEIRFRNESNGWTVATVRCDKKRVAAVGVMPFLAPGEQVQMEGEWAEHREYGQQIKVDSYQTVRPATKTAAERYLASGLISGVGPKTAKMLVGFFGAKVLDILDENPERLYEAPGIGPKRAAMIIKAFAEHRDMQSTVLFLQEREVPMGLAVKIHKKYGPLTREIVERDPYRLAEEIEGLGFKTADAIACSMGIAMGDERRLECGLVYALSEAVASEGHMFLPRGELMESAADLLGVDAAALETPLDRRVFADKLRAEVSGGEVRVYLPELYEAEMEVAQRLEKLLALGVKPISGMPDIGIELGEEQRAAVNACRENPVAIITGGPGTGKTTCIQCLIRLVGGAVELCAPTGRAAKRMAEATGTPARTIHRMLEYGGEGGGGFQRNQDRPLDCRAVIVDEASMLDIFLTRSLLRAIAPGTRLILVGDADQLPSVGAGNVLRDLIDSGVFATARLTWIYRQAQESMIVMNAHRINAGEAPVLRARDTNFFFERKDSATAAAQSAVALAKTRLPGFFGFDSLKDIQVMAPMKRGDAGVYELNRLLQEALNPRRAGVRELARGDTLFRVGDKVMQTKNDYEMEWERGEEKGEGVFNGDIGFIAEADARERALVVRFDDGREARYADSALEEIELAYCISVHKSQGSEFRAVVLPIVSGPPMLMSRNLLYTAVTRAREAVVIVGREDTLNRMVANRRILRRYSALAGRLRAGRPQT